MLQFIIPGVIILATLIIISIIFIRHFPQAAAIDVDSLPAEQEAAMKAALMERRLKRKVSGIFNKVKQIFRKVFKVSKNIGSSMHGKVSQLEQRYRKKATTMSTEEQQDVKQKIRVMLDQAEKQVELDQFSDAEQKYIEILSWDSKNLPAYFGLGELYMKKKQFSQAKETFEFLIRLIEGLEKGRDSLSKFSSPLTESQITEVYYDQAICLQVDNEVDKAKVRIQKALDRDENNPKYLDKKVEISILLKEKEEAREAFEALKKANPENQKLDGLEEKITQL